MGGAETGVALIRRFWDNFQKLRKSPLPAGRVVFLTSATSRPIRSPDARQARGESTSGWFVLAGLFALCLVPRSIMAWRMPGICPDAVLYIRLGKAIEVGHFQEALGQLRFNVYPFVLSYLHRLGLSWETAGVGWGVVISSCTILPLFGWIRLAFNRQVAIAACILYAIHSGLIRWSVEIIRDSTFWFLLALSLYLLWRAVTELRWGWYLAAGMAIALACLTRFEGLVLYIPLVVWLYLRGREGNGFRGQARAPCTHGRPDVQLSRNRLVVAGLVCASLYPLSLMLVNTLCFHGRTTDLVRTEPVALAQSWAQESITGQRAVEQQNRIDLLAPLPLWKMAQRFVTGMFKGCTPLYLLAIAGGIAARSAGFQPVKFDAGRISTLLRSNYWALASAVALILAAIWVHLYWSHEAGPRYFFPIVIMAAPLAGWGLLQISAAVANRVRQRHSPQIALLAGAAPLAVMLIVNLSVAWGSDVRPRATTVDLGHWVQEHYGSAAKMLGPDGITQVVNYYAHGRCESFPETVSAAAVMMQIDRLRPDVVLLSTDRRGSPGDDLSDCVMALGFEAVDHASLPGGCEKLQVLVQRIPNEGHVPSIHVADGTRSVPATSRGDKPRS